NRHHPFFRAQRRPPATMNRSQKKCLIVSAALHGLLLGIALFGSALMPSPNPPPSQPIQVFDPKMVTDALTTGGSPAAVPPAAPPPMAPPPPEVRPPAPEPKPEPPKVEPLKPIVPEVKRPEREVEPVKNPKPELAGDEPVKPKKKIVLDASDLKEIRHSPSQTRSTEAADSKARVDAEKRKRLAEQVSQSLTSLRTGLSSPTALVLPGPGDGGPLMANYRDIVAARYTAAWTPPADLDDETATVIANVTIDQFGNVVNAHITKRSGNSGMDKSIQNTLESVTFITPFPAGAKESQRTYNIKFNLQAKRSVG